MDVTDNIDEVLDPRIQIELENLNDATDDINKLETELDEAHTAFRQLLSETTKRLKEILNKVGNNSVEKARCYYEALEVARQAQIKCQQQAQLFQRASEIHAAAKETVALAESRFMSHQHEWNFDQAWQDMLNHATLKVMDAENQKAVCRREHYRRAVLFHDAEKRLLQLEEKHRRAIIKARPYFEVKAQCDQMLATQKERVECLQKAIQDAKTNYATSLRRLEEISNQIHQQRRDYDFIANGPREPGVGAELVSPLKTSSYDTVEINQLRGNKIKDITNTQLKKYNRISVYDNTYQLQEDTEYLGKRSVDGSEATSSQWELELEADMKTLNNLSLESSMLDHDSKNGNVSNSHFYNEENIRSSNFSDTLGYSFLQNVDYSLQSLSQSTKFSRHFQTLKNSLVNMPLMASNIMQNEATDPMMLNKRKINLQNGISKSLTNSPIKTNIFNLGSKFTEKGIRQSIAKYVPNNVFNFGFSNSKSQSSDNINFPLDVSSSPIEKYQNLNGIVGDKTDNLKFDTQVRNLKRDMKSFETKETDKNGLNIETTCGAQLTNSSRLNFQSETEVVAEKECLEHSCSNSTQFLSSSVSLTAAKVKKVVNLSDRDSISRKLIDDSSNSFAVQTAIKKRSNINELPLLLLFENDSALPNSRNKSLSMINLNEKKDFVLLNDLHLNNLKTLSTERLACLKHDLCFQVTR